MNSIFSRIARGEIPAYKIAENDEYLAFLDINPQVPGHTLVIPKQEVDRIWDLPADLLAGILPFAQPIAIALEKCFPCERCAITVIGLDVPHAHVHLLPIRRVADIGPQGARLNWRKEDFEEAQSRITAALQA